MNKSISRCNRASLALAVAMALGVGSAHAATITVTDGGDAGTTTTCTLRQAFEAANNDAVVGTCSAGAAADTVTFSGALANTTITLGGSQLDVVTNSTLTLAGSGQTIDAADTSRVIFVGDTASLTISRVTLTGGHAEYSSTDYHARDGGGIFLDSYASLSVTDATISGNTADNDGGGIYAYSYTTVTIMRSTISGNTAADDEGGGINLGDYATLSVADSTISGNTAYAEGGGIYGLGYNQITIARSTISGNVSTDGDGGGIYVSYAGTLDIRDSTISNNQAMDGDGGGIYIDEAYAATIANSTISGNSASYGGGGIYAQGTTWTVANSTITGNSSDYEGGGIVNADGYYATASLQLANTILSGNLSPTDADLAARTGSGPAKTAAIQVATIASSLLGTALQATYAGNGNIFSDVPGLGALANNGGATATMLPQPGSLAIDAGDNSLIPTGITTDQRGAGFARIANGTVDIGAVEVQAAVVPQAPAIPVPVRSAWTLGLLGLLLGFFGLRMRRNRA